MVETESVATDDPIDPARGRRDAAPLWVFAFVEAGAFVYYLVLSRSLWFFADEWEFLSGRGVNVHDLMAAHYGHWVAVPLVVYRALWETVGLRSYLPYVGLAIAAHLVAAVLLRVVMRRAGVRPWTATAAASVFVLFGAGAQDILWAFQITFTGALVLGLVHLLLADHDGPLDRRDAVGIAAGLLALMCSGVAVTMVAVVGIATLLRRGWRVAAVHTVPLGAVYGAWWLHYSHGKYSFEGSVRQVFDWTSTGAAGLFGGLGRVPEIGWLLGLVLLGGAVLVVREWGWRGARDRLVLPGALLGGSVVFPVLAGIDRGGLGASLSKSGRYLHIGAALMLPALAVAIDAIARRSRGLGAVALIALLVGVPGNVLQARDYARSQRLIDRPTRELVLSIARTPLARRVPRSLRPEANRAPTMTVGWLLDGVASGRVPSARPPTPVEARTNRLRLSLMELDERSGYHCRGLRTPTTVRLARGDKVGVIGKVAVVLVTGPSLGSTPVLFGYGLLNPGLSHTLVAVAGPLTLRIAPAGGFPPALCTAALG